MISHICLLVAMGGVTPRMNGRLPSWFWRFWAAWCWWRLLFFVIQAAVKKKKNKLEHGWNKLEGGLSSILNSYVAECSCSDKSHHFQHSESIENWMDNAGQRTQQLPLSGMSRSIGLWFNYYEKTRGGKDLIFFVFIYLAAWRFERRMNIIAIQEFVSHG